jgi:hypothetical protein
MTSTRTKTITLRVSHHTLAAIDDAAKRAGQDRNSYILHWVPEYYKAPPRARVVRAVARLDADGGVRIVDELVDVS